MPMYEFSFSSTKSWPIVRRGHSRGLFQIFFNTLQVDSVTAAAELRSYSISYGFFASFQLFWFMLQQPKGSNQLHLEQVMYVPNSR